MSITEKRFEELLDDALNSRRAIDDATHADHHEFIAMYRARWEARQKMWQRFKLSFVGGAAMAVVGALAWIGQLIIEHWPKTH